MLYGLAINKNAAMADFMEGAGEFIFWNVRLRWSLQDWEIQDLEDLLCQLYGNRCLGVGEDALKWAGSINGVFSVSSFFLWG